ncbi:MAG: YbaK/EbsC family protein [Anaerolineales bacterium]|nr:MAG: YbaK/EbsC family protein [Anaerolineales bacterium]
MDKPLSASAQRVQDALAELGFNLQVIELPASTRTALEAAQAVGCQVGQIVKSLVFRALRSDRPILVVASGINRVNESVITRQIGEPLGKADASFVRERTGFVIGGVPPVGHLESLETFIDQDLMQYSQVWAAAGTPNAVFELTPENLIRMTGGKLVKIT